MPRALLAETYNRWFDYVRGPVRSTCEASDEQYLSLGILFASLRALATPSEDIPNDAWYIIVNDLVCTALDLELKQGPEAEEYLGDIVPLITEYISLVSD